MSENRILASSDWCIDRIELSRFFKTICFESIRIVNPDSTVIYRKWRFSVLGKNVREIFGRFAHMPISVRRRLLSADWEAVGYWEEKVEIAQATTKDNDDNFDQRSTTAATARRRRTAEILGRSRVSTARGAGSLTLNSTFYLSSLCRRVYVTDTGRQATSQVSHTSADGGATTPAVHCWPPSIRCAGSDSQELFAWWLSFLHSRTMCPSDGAWNLGCSLVTSEHRALETLWQCTIQIYFFHYHYRR